MKETTDDKTIGLADLDSEENQQLELWFDDSVEMAHGFKISIKIKDVLCHYRSEFQQIAIFETEKLGRMLVLDDITMLTEFDEFAYHEMIVHVPLTVHPRPERVLVVGGGDGGTVRELLKHSDVKEIHVCEIDPEVVNACRKHLPSLAASFDDPRVRVFHEDGSLFVAERLNALVGEVLGCDIEDPLARELRNNVVAHSLGQVALAHPGLRQQIQ